MCACDVCAFVYVCVRKHASGGTGAMTKALNEDELDAAILLTEGCVKDIACGLSLPPACLPLWCVCVCVHVCVCVFMRALSVWFRV